jgi:hypothetical protein
MSFSDFLLRRQIRQRAAARRRQFRRESKVLDEVWPSQVDVSQVRPG